MFNLKYFYLFSLLLFSFSFVYSQGVGDFAYILKIDSSSTYPSSIYPNSEVSLNITLENISSISDAKNVKFTLHNYNSNIESLGNDDFIEVIKFGQTGTGVLRFKIKPNTPGGYYSIPFTINYDNDGTNHTIESQVSINVENYSKLNVIISNYPKSDVYLDDTVNISGVLKNEGNATLTGISINLNYSGKIIPLSETTLFIGDILPSTIKPFDFNLKIPKTADIGIYDMNIYAVDISSNSDTEKFSIIVEDKPTIIISAIDKSIDGDKTFLSQEDKFSLSVQLENISKSRAKSVSMKILNLKDIGFEGTDLAYVGSIDASDSGAGVFDLSILSNSKAENKYLQIEITYSDEYDVEHKMIKEINLLVSEKQSSGTGWFIFIIIVLASVIGYLYYKRKKKLLKIKSL